MNAVGTVLLADTGIDIGAGWLIFMVVMMVFCMGMMMFGMGRMGRGRGWSMPWTRWMSRETPMETLERRFARGEISVDEYRERREVIAGGIAEPTAHDHDEPVVAPTAGEGRKR
jgi:uncharacterized membrane protein